MAADGNVIGVVVKQHVGKMQHLNDTLVGDRVEDRATLLARDNEAATAQAGQVVRDLRLRDA